MALDQFVCIPKKDLNIRFLLGQKGNQNLVAIGLNPSKADENRLDPTSKNIKKMAEMNQCDGWYLLNLYPKRATKPSQLSKSPNPVLYKKNIEFINAFLSTNKTISKILFCWGNHVDHYPYLKKSSLSIMRILADQNKVCYSLGKTQKNHPMHPSPLNINRFYGGVKNLLLEPYDLNHYLKFYIES